jgi:alkanesulfonate monooxygenase SsuD/methylene tetrahydromethanopterin reductase-like flavin-dependent oxidoreductase (luciferase family)
MYNNLPSYRAMLDREGVEGPADVAIMGEEASVAAQLEHLMDIGGTEFVANEFGDADDKKRTRELLQSLLG